MQLALIKPDKSGLPTPDERQPLFASLMRVFAEEKERRRDQQPLAASSLSNKFLDHDVVIRTVCKHSHVHCAAYISNAFVPISLMLMVVLIELPDKACS